MARQASSRGVGSMGRHRRTVSNRYYFRLTGTTIAGEALGARGRPVSSSSAGPRRRSVGASNGGRFCPWRRVARLCGATCRASRRRTAGRLASLVPSTALGHIGHGHGCHPARFPAAADDVITPPRWRPLTAVGDSAAAAARRDLAAGRGGLAEVARVLEEFPRGGERPSYWPPRTFVSNPSENEMGI